MFFPELTETQRKQIAAQIAEMIDTFTNEGRLGDAVIPKNLSLCESCPEVILDLPGSWVETLRTQRSDDIEQWRRRRMTWYHQLRGADEVFGFARSIEVGDAEEREHRVIEVVPSTVAREFQNKIDEIDEKAYELPNNESTAALLYVPRYAFYGLITQAEGRISQTYPFFCEKLCASEFRLERESLVAVLSSLPSVFGALGESAPRPLVLVLAEEKERKIAEEREREKGKEEEPHRPT